MHNLMNVVLLIRNNEFGTSEEEAVPEPTATKINADSVVEYKISIIDFIFPLSRNRFQ